MKKIIFDSLLLTTMIVAILLMFFDLLMINKIDIKIIFDGIILCLCLLSTVLSTISSIKFDTLKSTPFIWLFNSVLWTIILASDMYK